MVTRGNHPTTNAVVAFLKKRSIIQRIMDILIMGAGFWITMRILSVIELIAGEKPKRTYNRPSKKDPFRWT